ncbi:MAG TPA: hypothetical protein DDX92_11845 [Flavobacteriales bacterium]|jgi:hypothetical protein|nr:hypothetical protein [Flavobacteriales bacterium]
MTYTYNENEDWDKARFFFESKFGKGIDLEGMLFLIGVREMGLGLQSFSKQEKMELIHIALCSLLEPKGFYELEKYDSDGWPHYKKGPAFRVLSKKDQQELIKNAIINYTREVSL